MPSRHFRKPNQMEIKMTTPNQPLLPTPRTDAAEKARQEYVSAIPDNLFSSLQDGQSEVGENWVKNAPPDGWSTARQLERELASRPAPPAPERQRVPVVMPTCAHCGCTRFLDFYGKFVSCIECATIYQDTESRTSPPPERELVEIAGRLNITLAAIHYDKCGQVDGCQSIDKMFEKEILKALQAATEPLRERCERAEKELFELRQTLTPPIRYGK